ncbi:hypothetical protein D3872_05710 [Massilia cavernae]|uniref:Uncharacterized protein n=1 Tax=Massilia cavernae TaxID=2320864 RepID=A0A418Y5Z4_9BURK|nr:hypothetical protein D3872_05710 [Massilia cavernae]
MALPSVLSPVWLATLPLPMLLMVLPDTVPLSVQLAVAVAVLNESVMFDVAVEPLLAAAAAAELASASLALLFWPVLLSLRSVCTAIEYSLALAPYPDWVFSALAVCVIAPPVLPEGLVAVLFGLAYASTLNASVIAAAMRERFIRFSPRNLVLQRVSQKPSAR